MNKEHLEFTDLIIIESLKETEKQSGKILFETLRNDENLSIKLKHKNVETKKEFYDYFEQLINETKEGFNPIIHFEIHGHPHKVGMQLKSGEIILWDYLYVLFKELNFNAKNNLIITLAVCQGAHLMSKIRPNDRCPWKLIIGTFKNIWTDDVIKDFTTFYKVLLETKNLNYALKALQDSNINVDYEGIDSEETFEHARNYFQKNINNPKAALKKGLMMLQAIQNTSSFESATQSININDVTAKILSEDDLINYFANQYKFCTENLIQDFDRFFFFWK